MTEQTAYVTFLSVVFLGLAAVTIALLAVGFVLMRRHRKERTAPKDSP